VSTIPSKLISRLPVVIGEEALPWPEAGVRGVREVVSDLGCNTILKLSGGAFDDGLYLSKFYLAHIYRRVETDFRCNLV
jgi:hypothetical protein